MKKKLEADLISIAHRILKLKNKEDLAQLHLETQKLYEKLSVLKFVEENFSDVKPTIGNSNIQELVNDALENEPEEEVEVAVAPEEIEIQPELVEEIEEEVEEEFEEDNFSDDEEEETEDEMEEEELDDEEEDSEEEEETVEEVIDEEESEENEEESEEEEFEPNFELFNVEDVENKKPKTEDKQISFEDLLGSSSEPVFERVFDPIQEETEEELAEEETESEEDIFSPVFEMEPSAEIEEVEKAIPNFEFDKEISINEAFAKTITFGLNDRIAFEKHLFAGSGEDLNRVVSQLSTFDTFEEAHNFIEDMVKPDYDNWEGKEEYVTRFMEIVEKKFA
jgi:hypothetical protein